MESLTLFNNLSFSFQEADAQENLFTRFHVLYKCQIINKVSKHRYTFDYQCNPATKEPNLKDCLYCLLSDMSAVECSEDVAEFLIEFGYTGKPEEIRNGVKAFKSCKRTEKAIKRLFTSEEIEALQSYYENY